MDSEGCTNQTNDCQSLNTSSFEKSDATCVVELVQAPSSLLVANEASSLGPITPDSDRENGDFPVDLNSPPTSVKKIASVACFDSEIERNEGNPMRCTDHGASPHTPKDGVFDPFAPGPDDLVLAPQCRKHVSKSRGLVARRLSFGSSIKVVEDNSHSNDAVLISDEEIVEAVYEILLETIVSKQTEVVLAEISSVDCDSNDCKTPPSAPRLNGIAETCPGAPMRPSGKSRKIDLASCRRLQFSP